MKSIKNAKKVKEDGNMRGKNEALQTSPFPEDYLYTRWYVSSEAPV